MNYHLNGPKSSISIYIPSTSQVTTVRLYHIIKWTALYFNGTWKTNTFPSITPNPVQRFICIQARNKLVQKLTNDTNKIVLHHARQIIKQHEENMNNINPICSAINTHCDDNRYRPKPELKLQINKVKPDENDEYNQWNDKPDDDWNDTELTDH